MVDWLKASSLIDSLALDRLLDRMDFHSEINQQTGELTEWPKRCKYANLKLVINPAKYKGKYWLELTGSLHRLWEGETNCQPFSFSSVKFAVDFVCNLCCLSPKDFEIRQIEFGVNLQSPPIETKAILHHLIGFKDKSFSPIVTNRHRSIGQKLTLTDYSIKVYNKSVQYDLQADICRVEVHSSKHVGRKFGISTLADLTEIAKMQYVGTQLVQIISSITFDDIIADLKYLTFSQLSLLTKGRNPRNLADMDRMERSRFRKLIVQHGTLLICEQLSNAVSDEWSQLLKC